MIGGYPKHYPEYLGMSYEQASREAHRLLKQGAEDGKWFGSIERLIQLREIMSRDISLAA